MATGIEVRGLGGLDRLSRAFREAGDQGKGFKRELSKAINTETKQTRKNMRAAILPGLPSAGGLGADVQRTTRFSTSTKLTGDNVGVRIRARGKRSIRRMNATGSFRHPVFGKRDTWVTQRLGVQQGFLDKPFQESRTDLQFAVLGAIARTKSNYRRTS